MIKKTNQIIPKPKYYQDFEAFKKSSDENSNQQLLTIKEQIMMNAVNVLLKRGAYGLFIYASDSNLKEAFANFNSNNWK